MPGLPATTPMVEDDPAALNTPGATCGITMTTGHNYGEFLFCVYHVYLVVLVLCNHVIKMLSNILLLNTKYRLSTEHIRRSTTTHTTGMLCTRINNRVRNITNSRTWWSLWIQGMPYRTRRSCHTRLFRCTSIGIRRGCIVWYAKGWCLYWSGVYSMG